jgi:uncharacterized protein (DUF1778 family)
LNKTRQIQLRVTPAQKSALVRRARSEGMDLSAWMLRRLAPPARERLEELVDALAKAIAPSFELAAIHDLLSALHRADFDAVTDGLTVSGLDALRANYLAAMVEATAARLERRPPAWVAAVKPLEIPWFASGLLSVRLHLLSSSPAPFRARNLFVDATVGDRV